MKPKLPTEQLRKNPVKMMFTDSEISEISEIAKRAKAEKKPIATFCRIHLFKNFLSQKNA